MTGIGTRGWVYSNLKSAEVADVVAGFLRPPVTELLGRPYCEGCILERILFIFEKGGPRGRISGPRGRRPLQTSFGEAEGRWGGSPGLSRGLEYASEALPTFIYSLFFSEILTFSRA